MAVCCVCLVHPPILLDSYGSEFGPPQTFEHAGWYLDDLAYVLLVGNAIVELLIGGFAHVWGLTLSQLHKLFTIDVSHVDAISSQEFLQQVYDVGDGAPLADIGTLE